jgi:hypothetical protein
MFGFSTEEVGQSSVAVSLFQSVNNLSIAGVATKTWG